MIRFLAILHRRNDVSPEAFMQYWREVHAPLVVQLPGIRKFGVNLVVECRVPGLQPDAMGELWWDSREAMQAAFQSPQGQAVGASGAKIIDQPRNTGITIEEMGEFYPEGHTTPVPPTFRSFAILHRRSDVAPEEFWRYWREVHAPIVVQRPGLIKFGENRVLESRVEGLQPDAIGELWWESLEARDAGTGTPRGQALGASGANILDQPRNTGLTIREYGVFYPPAGR